MILIRILLLVAALSVVPVSLVAQGVTAPSEQVAALQPGDQLRIRVWQADSLSGEMEVAADGTLRHPFYRTFRVAGVRISELEARLAAFLASEVRDPRITIEPLFRVAVSGQVRSPNNYLMAPEATVADAVTQAGGASEQGRLDRVTLVRGDTTRTFDLTDPDGDAMRTTVRSGDRIMLAQRRAPLRDIVGPAASILTTILTIVNFSRRR